MSVDGFLTFLSLMTAAYALLPRYRQLEIHLTSTVFDMLLLISVLLAIFYLHFFEVFAHLGWTPGWGLKNWGLSTDRAAYFSAGISTIVLFWRFKKRKLSRSSVFKFRGLVDELISSQTWAVLFSLMQKRLGEVCILYKSDTVWTKIRTAMPPHGYNPLDHLSHAELLDLAKGKDVLVPKATMRQKFQRVISWLLTPLHYLVDKITPDFSNAQSCAKDIIQEFLLSRRVNDALVELNPYLGLEFVNYDFDENEDFVETYLSLQIRNPKSALFKEIQRNLNSSSKNRYDFPLRNRILITLVKDVENAVKYQVWRPVAEGALEFIQELHASGNDDYAREPFNYDALKNDCPIQVSLWFFDIMVSEAFFQKKTWHMWLYYMTHYTKDLLRNLPELPTSENKYPTRYHHLIEDIVCRLINWVEIVEEAEPGQENATLDKVNAEHENGNIPKSAIICLGTVLNEIIECHKLTKQFKHDQLHLALSLYFTLKFELEKLDYATVLLLSMKNGGSHISDKSKLSSLQNEYNLAWETFDRIPYCRHEDYANEIASVLLGRTA